MQKKLLIFFASNTQYKHYVYILFPSKWYELLCVYWYGVATWNCLVSSWFSRQYYRKRYCYYTQVLLPCWQWRYIYEIEHCFINLIFKGKHAFLLLFDINSGLVFERIIEYPNISCNKGYVLHTSCLLW